MPKRIRPFSNGSQWLDWWESNCGRCKKAATADQIDSGKPFPCKIEDALTLASGRDGKVSEAIARRMGYFDHNPSKHFSCVWPCNEVEWTAEWKAECREGE